MIKFQVEDLDGGASGNAISDAIVDTRTDTLFIVVRTCVRYLIVVADVDCRLSA